MKLKPPVMSLTSLKQQYGQRISIFILMLLAASLFQFCITLTGVADDNVANQYSHSHVSAKTIDEKTSTDNNGVVADHADDIHHACCFSGHIDDNQNWELLRSSCPECSTDDLAVQPLIPESKSTFVLLYIVVEALIPNLFSHRDWQMQIEPRIHSSLPDIYLTKVSFLE